MTQHSKKLKVSLISGLLIFGLATGTVQADHNDYNGNVLAPLAAFVVLGSLLRHNHGHDYYYKRRQGHYGHNHGHGYKYSKRRYAHNGYQYDRRARSYSNEGYKRKSHKRNSRRIYQH